MPLVNTDDTELARKAQENHLYVRLYDPPVDGKTPLDGAGKPMSSPVQLRDKRAKLIYGFTEEPVGAEGPKLGIPSQQAAVPEQQSRTDAFAANAARAYESPSGRTST